MNFPKPTGINHSIHASIEVHQLQLSYVPGDVVRGVLTKVNIGNSPENVTAVIKLIAQIKTQITTESSNSNGSKSRSHYKGERTLLDLRQPVYEGHASPGINSWPFSITIPQEVAIQPSWDQGAGAPQGQALPPTVNRPTYEIVVGGHRDYLFVEYRLEAEIYQGSATRAIATFPIFVRPRSTELPVEDLVLRAALSTQSVKSLHLNPEYTDKSLSFRQHMSSIFHRSRLPEYTYTVVVEYPSIIQLKHPTLVPFRLRAIANSIKETAMGAGTVPEKPPALSLVSADIHVGSQTTTDDLEGYSYRVQRKQAGHWDKTPLLHWEDKSEDHKTIQIPTDVAAPDQVFDVGHHFQLFLTPRVAPAVRSRLVFPPNPIYPSFQTRHLSHLHELRWKLVVRCAGKNRKITGSAVVTLLGPSEQCERNNTTRTGPDDISRAHHDWADNQVASPMIAIDRIYGPLPFASPNKLPTATDQKGL